MRKLILATILLLAGIVCAHGQRFEWAKGYGSSMDHNQVVGTVADRDGNLYVLGRFQGNASWDGEELTPMTPWGGYHYTSYNVLIAKISPTGEMVWKKVIHHQYGSMAYDIKMVGDTAIACMVDFSFAGRYGYLYWLDTMIVGPVEIGGPYPSEQLIQRPEGELWVNSIGNTALLIFNFSGELLERHILQTSYIDTAGNDYLTPSPYWGDVYRANRLEYPAFDIDREGNIYIYRQAIDDVIPDSIGPRFGNVGGVKFWVNNRHVGTIHIDRAFLDRSPFGLPQVLKFSPHFDTLLRSRNLIQRGDSLLSSTFASLRLDDDGNIYILGNAERNLLMEPGKIVFDSIADIGISYLSINGYVGFVLCCDSLLTLKYCLHLKDSIRDGDILTTSSSFFSNICFDEDSGFAFVSGFVQRNHNTTAMITIRDRQLDLFKNDAFVFSFQKESGHLHSCAVVPSIKTSHLGSMDANNNLVAQNNRVFLQNAYYGGINYPNDTILLPNNSTQSLGLSVFDYAGNILQGMDYRAHHPRNRPGSITLVDSILYLSNNLHSSATFGEIQVPALGNFVWFAKYVDTSFMTPYVPGDTGEVRIVMVEDEGAWTSYPNPFRQRVNIQIEHSELQMENGVATAWLTDLQGRREEVRLERLRAGHYVLDLTARPQATYLLTLTTASGKQHTLKLLKQSDRFGD